MKKRFRVCSLLLAFVMLFATLNVSAYTQEITASKEIADDTLVADLPQGGVEKAPSSIKTQTENSDDTNTSTRSAPIEDGVYAIMSCAATNRWMTIGNDSPWEGAAVQHMYSTTSPASNFDRSSLFKISRVGTSNKYIIRSMLNNRMTIDITSSGVITKRIPALDSDVSSSDMFFIESNGNGYYIYSHSGRYAINMESTSNANLSYVKKTSATSTAEWSFIKYTGQDQSGMLSYRPSSCGSIGHIVGNTVNIELVAWSTYKNANVLSLSIRPGYEALGVSSWDSSTDTMALTAKNPGEIILDVKLTNGVGTEFFSGYFVYMIVPQEGTYYIQNAGTQKYIDIEGPSTSSGAVIQQWQFHIGAQEKWNIEHVPNSGGYVRLKSVYSNLYIGGDPSNTASVKQYNTQNDNTLWKICRSTSGNLIFKCKATESMGTVLSVIPNANSNGTDLIRASYSNNTDYWDEWDIYKIEYFAHVYNYYDLGYAVRYGETEAVSASKIHSYNEAVAEQYVKLMGLSIMPSTPQYYQSPIDICKGTVDSSNIDTLCSHGGTIHTNRSSVVSNFNNTHSGNNVITNILWSCHRIVSTATNGDINYNRSCSSGTGIFLIEISTSYRDRNSSGVLMHELNHQYGAKDHYHELADKDDPNSCKFKENCSECGNNPRPSSCIMYQSRIQISDDGVVCSDCKQDMFEHLNSHHNN